MYALAVRLLGNPATADDAFQEAWVRIATRLGTFRGESSLRTWLCSVVVNCCREQFHARTFEELGDVPIAPDPDVGLDVERAVRALPAGYRAVVVLHDIEGYTHDEIAELLNIEPGTSKSQLSRGRSALRRLLGARHTPTRTR